MIRKQAGCIHAHSQRSPGTSASMALLQQARELKRRCSPQHIEAAARVVEQDALQAWAGHGCPLRAVLTCTDHACLQGEGLPAALQQRISSLQSQGAVSLKGCQWQQRKQLMGTKCGKTGDSPEPARQVRNSTARRASAHLKSGGRSSCCCGTCPVTPPCKLAPSTVHRAGL